MYESYFSLSERPFGSVPKPQRYFPAESIEEARRTLTRCIDRAEGCGLIIGPAGTGKTLLCQVLAEQFKQRFSTVLLSTVRLASRKELLQAILFELDLPYRRLQEGELRLSLIDHLAPKEKCPEGMLLLVDEAHNLSPSLMEELRLLTNLVRGGSLRIRLVVAGGPILEERFASPRLASFNQRIAARCYLAPLTSVETQQYIQAQVAAAGGDPDQCITDDARRAVYSATNGCPRLINQLCDLALLTCANHGIQVVDAHVVEHAWSQLQQLPGAQMPMEPVDRDETESAETNSTVIEFGSLDEDDELDVEAAAREDASAQSQVDESEFDPAVDAAESEVSALDTEANQQDDLDNPASQSHQSPEPVEQLDTIESQLSEVELSFEPDCEAASESCQQIDDAGQHVSLRFEDLDELEAVDDSDDSGAETCEPVSVDDYASLEANNVVQLAPSVHIPDENAEGDALTVKPQQPLIDKPQQPLIDEPDVVEVEESEITLVFENPSEDSTSEDANDDAKPDHAAQRPGLSHSEDQTVTVVGNAFGTQFVPAPSVYVGKPPVMATADQAPNDARSTGDEGAVEDPPTVEPSQPVAEHPTIPVRRREYRQLFAKLRHAQEIQLEQPARNR